MSDNIKYALAIAIFLALACGFIFYIWSEQTACAEKGGAMISNGWLSWECTLPKGTR